jgi:urease accessory protein
MLPIAQSIQQQTQVPTGEQLSVTLSYEQRFLRRKKLVCDDGTPFLVELGETVSMNAGDAFLLEDGTAIVVKAAIEPLLAVYHDNLPRIAWHIGNRHTPCQIEADHILILRDHVLEGMLTNLGARTAHTEAAFTPEGGAYGHGRTHSHDH